jgi:hypothetical protein
MGTLPQPFGARYGNENVSKRLTHVLPDAHRAAVEQLRERVNFDSNVSTAAFEIFFSPPASSTIARNSKRR